MARLRAPQIPATSPEGPTRCPFRESSGSRFPNHPGKVLGHWAIPQAPRNNRNAGQLIVYGIDGNGPHLDQHLARGQIAIKTNKKLNMEVGFRARTCPSAKAVVAGSTASVAQRMYWSAEVS